MGDVIFTKVPMISGSRWAMSVQATWHYGSKYRIHLHKQYVRDTCWNISHLGWRCAGSREEDTALKNIKIRKQRKNAERINGASTIIIIIKKQYRGILTILRKNK